MLSAKNFPAIVLLALFCLVRCTDACYNVAMSYKVDESYEGHCPKKTDERLLRVTKLSLKHGAGMLQGLNDLEWTAYIQEHDDLVIEENLRDAAEAALNHANPKSGLTNERALQRRLNPFCDYWCIAHGLYCFCSTSTSWRRELAGTPTSLRGRKLGTGEDLDLTDPAVVAQLEEDTKQEAYGYLKRWDRHLECLEHPYQVSVTIQDCSATSHMLSTSPSDSPSTAPSDRPSTTPSDRPSTTPSDRPSDVPSTAPSQAPSEKPSNVPSQPPSEKPSSIPSHSPSETPSEIPSEAPSKVPTQAPTSGKPSTSPSYSPTDSPTADS